MPQACLHTSNRLPTCYSSPGNRFGGAFLQMHQAGAGALAGRRFFLHAFVHAA